MDHPFAAPDSGADTPHRIRTVSEARWWLAGLARGGADGIRFQEPFLPVGRGLVLVQASLQRADGTRVNVAIYCYDDTPPDVVDWLPPIPEGRGPASF